MDISVKAARTIGSQLVLTQGDYDHERPICPILRTPGLTKSDKHAMMTYCFCGEALGFMYGFAKQLLDEISTEVKEIVFEAKMPERTVAWIDDFGPRNNSCKGKMSHEVLRVSRRKGKDYVLDIAGAQYGYDLPVVPWDEYARERIVEIQQVRPFGFNHDQIHSRIQRFWRPHMRHTSLNNHLVQQYHIGMRAQVMENAVRRWLKSGTMRLSELLKKDCCALQVLSEALVRKIDDSLRMYNVLAKGKPPIVKFYGGEGIYASRPSPERPDPNEYVRERELRKDFKISALAEMVMGLEEALAVTESGTV
ncbi:MAG: hypothetical protein Q9160_006245 [Pyrenula sp. 1 TL-2023]